MYDVNQSPTAYEAEVKRMQEANAPDAEMSKPPLIGAMRIGMLGKPVAASVTQRIAELSKGLTEAGYELEAARSACREANGRRARWESEFTDVSSALVQAIQEHREVTPEGVPYPAARPRAATEEG